MRPTASDRHTNAPQNTKEIIQSVWGNKKTKTKKQPAMTAEYLRFFFFFLRKMDLISPPFCAGDKGTDFYVFWQMKVR